MKKFIVTALFCTLGVSDVKIPMEANKIYIIDFFASWCSSCEKEIPILSKLNERIKQKGIELIAVDVDKRLEDGKAFQQKLSKHFTFKVINDPTNEIISSYKPIGMPAIYVVKNNQICGKIFGAIPNLEEKLFEQIKLCEEKK